jgi:alpha-amylase/alpha-mannosidase (GH57 family)
VVGFARMGRIRYILGIHAHQPVGNLPELLTEAYHLSYLPFLKLLSEFPKVPFALHCSGVLFDWLESTRPDFLDRLAGFAARGQIELLPGGQYEPIETLNADAGGFAEVLISSPQLALLLEPARGGGVIEVDARAKAFNLGNTLIRPPEASRRKPATSVQP